MYQFAVVLCLAAATQATAQEAPSGRVPDSAVGRVGQRQPRDQAMSGVAPTVRINTRIQNRVQSRIRNRVDRNYDTQANALSPFLVAGDEARTAARFDRR